jgi:eukaryotic-like serine/threonine-protein kinase
MESAAPLVLGGRYRIGALLGEGAMATVSRGYDVLLDRDVAVKILRPEYARDERFVQRFYAEARSAARLVDRHIVTIYDVPSEAELHAFVMEFVDGPSLSQLLARDGPLGEARTVAYARQIAHALETAHAGGILHRDIKPANVLVGPGDVAKVADFGLAKAALAGDELALTEPGRLVGSASYFSPEQAQGLALTPASDLYSLGVTMYQLVTGTLPFDATSALASAVAHVTSPPPARDALERVMSPGLAAIVERLLRKDPAARYASANALDAALAAIEHQSPIAPAGWDAPTIVGSLPIVAPARRATFWTHERRRRAAMPAALVTAAALLALSLTLGARPHQRDVAVRTTVPLPQPTSALVAMPNVRGMALTSARAAMLGAHLNANYAARVSTVLANTVIDEYPAAGTPVRRQSSALVIISAGPQPPVRYTEPASNAAGWMPPGWRKHPGKHHGGDNGGD